MATLPTVTETPAAAMPTSAASLLIALAPLDRDGLAHTLEHLAEALPNESLIVATPDATPDATPESAAATPNIRIVPYTPASASNGSWLLTAADFQNAARLAKEQNAGAILLLGADSGRIPAETLRALAAGIATGADLVSPGYRLGAREGLVNSAILYPVTRALFGTRPRYPIAIDLGLSLRMAEKLGAAAARYTAINQPEALLWPLAEATSAGFTIAEIPNLDRPLPQPAGLDLNTVLARVAGSLFADVDAKAALWQRIRTAAPRTTSNPLPEHLEAPDVASMIESFRIGYTNLAEIWSLVLPPNSLVGLKRLAATPPASFRLPDALWARIVYDFILAYRLRTLNRGHLLGALTPLYLAWVASHLLQTADAVSAERHIETLAQAFEADKPYLVSRWRWPDRFNP